MIHLYSLRLHYREKQYDRTLVNLRWSQVLGHLQDNDSLLFAHARNRNGDGPVVLTYNSTGAFR